MSTNNDNVYVAIYNVKLLTKSLNCVSELANIRPLLSNIQFSTDIYNNIIKNSVCVYSDFHVSALYFYDYLNFANVYGAKIIVSGEDSIKINKHLANKNCFDIITNDNVESLGKDFVEFIEESKKKSCNHRRNVFTLNAVHCVGIAFMTICGIFIISKLGKK